jgi:hypothetical protein
VPNGWGNKGCSNRQNDRGEKRIMKTRNNESPKESHYFALSYSRVFVIRFFLDAKLSATDRAAMTKAGP